MIVQAAADMSISTKSATSTQVDLASAATRAEAQRILEALLRRTPAVLIASLSTVDGRAYAYARVEGAATATRIAPITSSLLALSESFAREALRGSCTNAAVSSDIGSIVIVRVPTKGRKHALAVAADRGENLAMVMRLTLDTADAVAKVIDLLVPASPVD